MYGYFLTILTLSLLHTAENNMPRANFEEYNIK